MTWLSLSILLSTSAALLGVVKRMYTKSQRRLDRDRTAYVVTFPPELDETRVMSWLRSISGALRKQTFGSLGVQSIVFETWATDHGITHRVLVPWQEADYIISQMRTLVPGVSVVPDNERPRPNWTQTAEIGMSKPSRTLSIPNSRDASASVLAAVQALNENEAVVVQWVFAHAEHDYVPEDAPSNEPGLLRRLLGVGGATRDEINDRRAKQSEPNMLSIGRVGAVAETNPRAAHLVDRVTKAFSAFSTAATYLKSDRRKLVVDNINEARTPHWLPAQFSLSELSALISWPIGQPFVAGLPRGASRHLFAGEDIPRTGRLLGYSNFPGHERPIALPYHRAVEHFYVGGAIGGGKSTLMANSFAQDVANGYGGIVIDASNSESHESLFYRALNYIPKDRVDDVIVIDVMKDRDKPVGFNVLDQGNPRVVVDQVTELISHLYNDTSGVWVRQLLFHGLYTLSDAGNYALTDLPALLSPKTPDEVVWADEMTRANKNPELKAFWTRWENMPRAEREKATSPLLNRIWQITARSEIANIVGQTNSAFKWSDVLANNKIVLISLIGLPKETASIMGTLIVNALWTAAQTMSPERPNFLYLDEFQLMTRLPMGLEDMLRLARKHGLGVVMGTQYIDDLSQDMKNAIINAVRSRMIFSTSSKEARIWQAEFGRQHVDERDLISLQRYEAIAQISTDAGISNPATLKALPPLATTGVATQALIASAKRYGTPVSQIENEKAGRRKSDKPAKKRPSIGYQPWGS